MVFSATPVGGLVFQLLSDPSPSKTIIPIQLLSAHLLFKQSVLLNGEAFVVETPV